MTLRSRLFLFFGGLIALLVSAEWWLVSALTADLEREIDEVAFEVGASVAGVFAERLPEETWITRAGGPSEADHDRRDHARSFAVSYSTRGPGERVVSEGPAVSEHGEERVIVASPGGERGGPWFLGGTPIFRRIGSDDHELFLEPEDDLFEQRHIAVTVVQFGDIADDEVQVEGEREGLSVFFPRRDPPVKLHVGGLIRMELADGVPAELVARGTRVGYDFHAAEWQVEDDEPAPAAPAQRTARIPIPREGLEAATERLLSRLLLGSFAILGLGLVIAGYAAHRVSYPLRGLARAARDVEGGELGAQASERGDPEVAETIAAFNSMSVRLEELAGEAEGLRRREHLTELGEVARGLVHTLRNPLNVLGLTVEELVARSEDTAGLAEAARAQILRIDRSLRVFLSLSSGGAGAVERVAIDDVARDVALELLHDTTSEVRVTVADRGGPVEVLGVAPELRAVLHVLMVNAVEASPPGAKVEVTVGAGDEDGARIEVLDEGQGLAPEVRARLFTPHTTTKQSGAGMGLYLAQRIVTSRYGGTLALADREPRGTRALLTLQGRTQESND